MRSITHVSAVLASLILGGLGILTFADIALGPGTDRQERVAETPVFPTNLPELKRFVGKTRYYIGERYGLKERFIAWNGAVKIGAFDHSPAANVALGQDGFLFLTTQGALEIAQGQGRLSEAETAQWGRTFRKLQSAFDEVGADYTLVMGPNKHTIYPEALPRWITPVAPSQTRTEDIVRTAKSVFGSGFPDARQILSAARGTMAGVDLYHPTDTHWTELGAALVIHEAFKELGLDVPPPEFKIADLPRSGDLSRMIGQQGRWSASAPELPRTWQCRDATGAPLNVVTIDPLMPDRFSCGSATGSDARLVVFHDSFGVSAIPYIAARFKHVDFIWTDAAEPATAEDLEADYVLHIIVERRFISDTPELLLLKKGHKE